MDYRTRSGETLRADSPLIREQFNASNLFRVKYPKSIATPTISKIIEQKMAQAGIRRVDHVGSKEGPKMRKEISLIHGFRKFFNTALMNADVHPVIKELLMDHSVKLDDFYYDKGSKKSKEKLLDEYIKAVDNLTISEENRLRIKVESEKQKEDRVSVLEKYFVELRNRMDSLNQAMNDKSKRRKK